MVQPIANDGLLCHGSATVLQLSAFIVAAASLCTASPVSSQPFGSGNVSFVNVDKVEIDLLVTDNVNNEKKTFHLGVGKESSTFNQVRDLNVAQQRLIAALLRAPGLAPMVRGAGLTPQHFPRELAAAFAVAIAGDRDQILRTVQNGGNEVARLHRLGVEMGHAQALQIARQIEESVDREQRLQTNAPDTDDSADYVTPVLKALPNAPVEEVTANGNGAQASAMAAVPSINGSSRAGEPKPSGTALKAAVEAFLRDRAPGPAAAKEIERLAILAGLLDGESR